MSCVYQEDRAELNPDSISSITDPNHGPITIFHDVVIASEIVQPYPDGKAFKCRDELEAYAWTVEGRWVKAGGHPEDAIISDRSDVNGRTINSHYVKNLKDPKTGRPNRAGVRADIQIFDKKIAPDLLEAMKKGTKRDVSIGFFYTADKTSGKVSDGPFKDEAYDYVQRNMFHDHLAVAIDNGRCPSPYCGLGADDITSKKLTNDPFAGFANWNACITEIMGKNPKLTKVQAEGICGNLKAKHEDIMDYGKRQNILAICSALTKECNKEDAKLEQSGELKAIKATNIDEKIAEYSVLSAKKMIDAAVKELLKDI